MKDKSKFSTRKSEFIHLKSQENEISNILV